MVHSAVQALVQVVHCSNVSQAALALFANKHVMTLDSTTQPIRACSLMASIMETVSRLFSKEQGVTIITSACWIAAAARLVIKLPDGRLGI